MIFLTAAEEPGLAPAACLVVEDASSGVQAAKAGRMAALGWRAGRRGATRGGGRGPGGDHARRRRRRRLGEGRLERRRVGRRRDRGTLTGRTLATTERVQPDLEDLPIAAIGGGRGLAATLSALRLAGARPTAIIAMAGDGGSSGRLRRELGVMPPGDVRKALLALAEPASPIAPCSPTGS